MVRVEVPSPPFTCVGGDGFLPGGTAAMFLVQISEAELGEAAPVRLQGFPNGLAAGREAGIVGFRWHAARQDSRVRDAYLDGELLFDTWLGEWRSG